MKKLILLFLICLTVAGVAMADVFSVKNMSVEATADSGVKAKDAAISEGTVRAFGVMMNRMVLAQNRNDLPALAAEDVSFYIKDMVIDDEKTTATKYSGVLNIQFKDKEIQEFLRNQNVPFTVQDAPVFLVIPVWTEGETRLVWDEANPLYGAVKRLNNDMGLYRFVLPAGDSGDVEVLVSDVVDGTNLAQAMPLVSKYKAGYVLWISVKKDGQVYDVHAREYPADETVGGTMDFTASSTAAVDQAAYRLLKKAVGSMEVSWRQERMDELSGAGALQVTVPAVSLVRWAAVRKKMDSVKGIGTYVVKSFKDGRIVLVYQLEQPVENVVRALALKGLDLHQDFAGDWVLESK